MTRPVPSNIPNTNRDFQHLPKHEAVSVLLRTAPKILIDNLGSSPLKAKVAIRDQWENKEAPTPESISNLKKVLGKDVRCEPDFEALFADLDSVYEDKVQFVTAILSSIKVWCQALSEVIESADNEEWADKLLEQLDESGMGSLRLTILVSTTQAIPIP